MVIAGEHQFTLGFTRRGDEAFSHDVSIVDVDRTDGSVHAVADVGFDAATDESESITVYTLVAASETTAWIVQRGTVDGAATDALREFDLTSGEQTAIWESPRWELTTASGECNDLPSAYHADAEGTLYALVDGLPAVVDVASQSIEAIAAQCSDTVPTLDTLLTDDDIAAYTTSKSGSGLERATVSDLYWATHPTVDAGEWVTGASAWWRISRSSTFDGTPIHTGAIVEFDLAERRIVQLLPLGALAVDWTPEDDRFDLAPLQADLLVHAGAVWILDSADNGRLHRLDPATGAISSTVIDPVDADYTTAALLDVDPAGVWLDVTRWTEIDESSASGPSALLGIDTATGAVTHDIAEAVLMQD